MWLADIMFHFTLRATAVCSPHCRQTSSLPRDGSGVALSCVCELRGSRELRKDFEERSKEGFVLPMSAVSKGDAKGDRV